MLFLNQFKLQFVSANSVSLISLVLEQVSVLLPAEMYSYVSVLVGTLLPQLVDPK